ncbi:MAG TPA: ATP-dependent zinc metalloprotease FtsH [Solirubrobacteraceae bacterium]|nr:ATP-dependent zinc metalloprotease FtsH [Solirubrobacteraceae bacterium]
MADRTPRSRPGARNDEAPDPWRVEGRRDGDRTGGSDGRGRFPSPFGRTLLLVFLAVIVVNVLLAERLPEDGERSDVSYTFFLEQVERGNVSEVNSQGDVIQGDFERAVRPPKQPDAPADAGTPEPAEQFETVLPAFALDTDLLQTLRENRVQVNADTLDEGRSFLLDFLLFFGPTLLIFGLIFYVFRRAAKQGGMGGMGGMGGLGRSKAKRYDATQQRVKFDDVAGIDEAEDELVEIVDFLKNPDRYRKLGAAIPKGVLLSGPPGTGKTLLARAVAGEADVPFFSMSASEFIEMVVGVGASRVRDLFEQAKKTAPAIIFIDELDAIGRQRGGSGGGMGGHDEREQTLNQILTEMDGFTGSEGVIVLAATNRPDVLDAALLRPGRFDRRVHVNPPDKDGRRLILEVHTRSVPLDDEVRLADIAATTPGMVGADLRNLVNEAALLAARRDHQRVRTEDSTDAMERIVLGAERRITISPAERERTAHHEAGHAVLGMLEPGADPVRKVSIVPRGRALGVTFQAPETDRYGFDAEYLHGKIVGALGGRAAEQIIYGNVTTGAESDLEQVTNIARQMVGRWGMSERIGLVSVLPRPDDGPLFPGVEGPSDATRELVDEEVRRIVEGCYDRAVSMLTDNRDKLESLAGALLEHETLDEDDALQAAGFERRPQAVDKGGKEATISARDEPGDPSTAP